MDDTAAAGTPAPRTRRRAATVLAGATLATGLAFAGLTAATAQSDPTPSPSAAPGPPGDRADRKVGDLGKGHGKGHGKGRGHGKLKHLRDVLHGEHTTRAADGTFRTTAVQNGTVTAVSPTSISVRSEDGFTRTYAVTSETSVRSADEGIRDVAVGDRVHVRAVVAGGTATAEAIVDVSEVERRRDRRD